MNRQDKIDGIIGRFIQATDEARSAFIREMRALIKEPVEKQPAGQPGEKRDAPLNQDGPSRY
jgi:hypothetical protein